MGLLDRVASIFLPPYQVAPYRSAYADDPERIRLERAQQTQSIQRFYQADIEDALAAADAGDLSLLAQLSRGMRRDGTLAGLLSTRTSGLTRLPKLFRGTPTVVRHLENRDGETGLFDRIFAPKELSRWIADGILCGVQLGELVPLPDRPEPVFVRLDPEFLRYQWGDDRWYFYSVGGPIHVVPGDGRWVLGLPGGLQNPWHNALWGLARANVSKDHAFHFREAYSSALANPARVAYTPPGSTADDRASMLQKLIAWGLNTAFALPPGWDVKLLELASGTTHKVFQETIDSSDKEIIMQLAGQLVTVTGGTGFANADIHATIRSDLIQDDGDHTCSTLNEQALRPIVNRMFGRAARGTVAIDTKPPANLAAEATSITAAMQAVEAANRVLAPYGLRVDAREIATRYRVPTLLSAPAPDAAADPAAPPAPLGQVPAVSLVKPLAEAA